MFFLPETRGHLPVSEKAAKSLSKGVCAQEGERMGGERGRGSMAGLSAGPQLPGSPEHPQLISGGGHGARLVRGQRALSSHHPPAPLSHRFPLMVLEWDGMYWDPWAWHWHTLRPISLALGHAGTHSPSAGTCWDAESWCWDVLGSMASVLGYAGIHSPRTGTPWDAQFPHWSILGPIAFTWGFEDFSSLALGCTGTLMFSPVTSWVP